MNKKKNNGSDGEATPDVPEQKSDANAEPNAPEQAEAAPSAGADEEKAQLKDQLLRMAADFDNYRKRTRRELEDVRKYGIETLLTDILGVVDNLDRALAHTEDDKSPMVVGLRMVQKQFADVLGRYGVKAFSAVGQSFDPEKHEAVGQAPASADKVGTVLEEMQKGYMLHDRLLRPARVVVATAPAEGRDEEATAH